jgi:hypothetical protein
MCARVGGGRVDVSPFSGGSGGCVTVLGVTEWMWYRVWGDRVGMSLCWGMCPRFGGDRVDLSPSWG